MKFVWTELAACDLESIYDFTLEQFGSTEVFAFKFDSTLKILYQHPEIGKKGRVPETREIVIAGTPFIIAYSLKNQQIQILSIIHGARKWPDRL